MITPAFRRAWLGATISAAGDAASWVALIALAIGPAPASVAWLVVSYTAPVAVGGLFAGWALDRFDRRTLMIVDNVVRATLFASLPIALAAGRLTAVHLYFVAAVYGLLKMVSLAGFPSLIPDLVPADRLEQANALEGVSFGLASLVGALLAGLAVSSIGAGPALVFDTASYLAFALALGTVRAPTRGAAAKSDEAPGIIRLAVRDRTLRSTTIMFALFNIGEGALLVFLPRRAADLGLGAGGYGYLVAATTGGELLAALWLARRAWPWALPGSIIAAQVTAAAAVSVLLIDALPTTIFALLVLGACAAPMTAWAQTLRMRIVPPGAHGRLFSLLRTTMQATPPLGAGLAALTLSHGSVLSVLAVVVVMGTPALLLAPDLLHRLPAPVDGAR